MIVTIIVIAFVTFAMNAEGQTKQEIIQNISATAKVADIDPDLAVAIATVESGLNPKAIGGLGEVGLFQLRPEYHPVVRGNPNHNILVAMAYLAEIRTKCGKFNDAWFVCFNYGPHNKLKRPHQTQYYKRVMSQMNRIKAKRYLARN